MGTVSKLSDSKRKVDALKKGRKSPVKLVDNAYRRNRQLQKQAFETQSRSKRATEYKNKEKADSGLSPSEIVSGSKLELAVNKVKEKPRVMKLLAISGPASPDPDLNNTVRPVFTSQHHL